MLTPASRPLSSGTSDITVPWRDPVREARTQALLHTHPLPWHPGDEEVTPQTHLGVYLFTPHYTPHAFSMPVTPETTMRQVLDTILDCAPGDPMRICDFVVPLNPQRYGGYLFAIRMPSIARGLQGGMSGVVLDLGCVGGHYFATFLPKSIAWDDLRSFIRPLIREDVADTYFYIGSRSEAWPPGSLISLRDGDVIFVTAEPGSGCRRPSAEELLRPGNELGPMQHFFDLESYEATCVLYDGSRYTIPPYYHTGRDILSYVTECFRIHPAHVASCSFPVTEFDVHGMTCPFALAVFEIPAIREGDPVPNRRDVFTFCDLRPLGHKPKVVHSHIPLLHIPSILADVGIQLPPAFSIGVLGGRLRGEVVRVKGNSTLVIYAKEAQSEDSSGPTLDSSSSAESSGEPAQRLSPWGSPPQLNPPAPEEPLDDEDFVLPESAELEHHDPTLPDGHSWNYGTETSPLPTAAGELTGPTQVFEPPDHGHPVVSSQEDLSDSDDVADAHRQSIMVLVYVPDYLPEMYHVPVRFPCSPEQLLQAVRTQRQGGYGALFPHLIPVTPHLTREYACLVALPDWARNHAVVLLDCSRINDGVFVADLPTPLNRESLLLAAHLPVDSDIGVFVHGLVRPLARWQIIHLVAGMSIAFLPAGLGAPDSRELDAMLLQDDGWDPNAEPPGPRYTSPNIFRLRVLTDGMPCTFATATRYTDSLREMVAAHLQATPHRMSFIASKPRIVDFFSLGFPTSGVIVATEQLSRVPYPPARFPERRVVLMLDCRRILLGFRWLLLLGRRVDPQTVINSFQQPCPAGYVLAFLGVETHTDADGSFWLVDNGRCITVDYTRQRPNDDHLADDRGPPRPPPTARDPPFSEEYAYPTAKAAPPPPRSRSRSPSRGSPSRGAASRVLHCDQLKVAHSPTSRACKLGSSSSNCAWIKWQSVTPGDVLAENERCVTPVLLAVGAEKNFSGLDWAADFLRSQFADRWSFLLDRVLRVDPVLLRLVCRLLQEPCSDRTRPHEAYSAARRATRQFGQTWPLTPGYRPLPGGPPSDASDEGHAQDATLVQATFVLLAPGYTPETLQLQLLVPQDVPDVLDLVDTCRARDGRDLFPILTPAFPQPDPRCAYLLAFPEWVHEQVPVLLDLTMLDGRIFCSRG